MYHYMEYTHEPNSMQVFPGQFRIPVINYRINSAEEKTKSKNRIIAIGEELEKAKLDIREMDEFLMSKNKKISALETENTEMNTELETKTKKISVLQKEKQQKQEELRNLKMEFLRSCFEFSDFCARDQEYFSTYVHKIQDFLKSNLTALQTLYSSIYKEMYGDDLTEAGHALVDLDRPYKNRELKPIEEDEVSRNDFSTIPNILKNFAENVESPIVMMNTENELKSLKDRLIQLDDVSKKDKLKIEEITFKCTYALRLLIETNLNHT